MLKSAKNAIKMIVGYFGHDFVITSNKSDPTEIVSRWKWDLTNKKIVSYTFDIKIDIIQNKIYGWFSGEHILKFYP